MDQSSKPAAPAPRRPRRDARINRRHILGIAQLLFSRQGVAATSMNDIANAASVGKGTLYRHFAHKGEICFAIMQADVAAFQERVGALISADDTPPLERLNILLVERIHLMEKHQPLFAAIDEAATDTRRTRPFRGAFGTWVHAQIVELLGVAVERGDLAALDRAFAADVILNAVSPALYHYQRHTCNYSVEQIVSGIQRLFIDGLR